MSSKTEIANMALSHLGIGKEIADLDTENSQDSRACRRFFNDARQAVLRDFPWPFATKFATLGLVSAPPTETTEWKFSYRYPADCLKFRRIPNADSRIETADTRVVYREGQDSQGRLIYTDQDLATCEYTIDVTGVENYSSDFVIALSLRLAAYIAPRLTAGDPFKMGERALKLYLYELQIARANAIGEEQPDRPIESEFITGRN